MIKYWYIALLSAVLISVLMVIRITAISDANDARHDARFIAGAERISALEIKTELLQNQVIHLTEAKPK